MYKMYEIIIYVECNKEEVTYNKYNNYKKGKIRFTYIKTKPKW